MTKNLLVELGLEEMPAYVVTPSMKQLQKRMAAFLDDNRLSYEKIEMFSTPRRLAVRVTNLADFQSDLIEDFKGPAKKIAVDEEGQFTKAAQGFVRGKGLTVDDITFKTVNGTEYVYVTKEEKGKPIAEIIDGVSDVLKEMAFPVNMHWAKNNFEYIRPVHTLTVLLDDESYLMTFLDIESGRTSRGHRFLGHDTTIQSADTYEQDLRDVFVIANSVERENQIIDQIKEIEQKHHVKVDIDEGLLNEVLNLVEYPTAFIGSFDQKYMELPEEVLITSMKKHQRYFTVRDQNDQLLPYFVSVRNGDDKHIENVIKGNQKVLLARLEDAEFFWKEDQKLAISDLVEKLKKVTFHEKIGSVYDHMARTKDLAEWIAETISLSSNEIQDVKRAADIYKFDLLTGMVDEFDELQGIMGEKYAIIFGENNNVAAAIREHYLPTSSDGDLPDTKVGAVLALADKLETVFSFFSADLIPSGSNDPYALRRATQGIVRILDKFGWSLSIEAIMDQAFAQSNDSFTYKNKEAITDFILTRIEKIFDKRINKDIVQAVMKSNSSVVRDLIETAKALQTKSKEASFKSAVESLARVSNLVQKAETKASLDPTLFENDSEKALYQAISDFVVTDDITDNIDRLFALRDAIDVFFEQTMVMTDDKPLRQNRLALLTTIQDLALSVADFSCINTK